MHTALAVTHVAFEDLGSLGIELTHAGFNIELIDACTTNMRTIDALDPDLIVVLGGPIGVYEHDAYPFIEAEIELLRSRLAAKRPTLGICLGAQLMAAALGARVYPGLHGKELDWALVDAGSENCSPPWFGAYSPLDCASCIGMVTLSTCRTEPRALREQLVILTRLSRWETMRWHSSFIPK